MEDALELAAWLTSSWRKWIFLSLAAVSCAALALHHQLAHAKLLP